MDFEVVDYYAQRYYLGNENFKPSLNFTLDQHNELNDIVSKARLRDDQWIIDHLDTSSFNKLVIIGWYIDAKSKSYSMSKDILKSKQVQTFNYNSQLSKIDDMDPLRTKVLILHNASKEQRFLDIGAEFSKRGFEVKIDHPVWI